MPRSLSQTGESKRRFNWPTGTPQIAALLLVLLKKFWFIPVVLGGWLFKRIGLRKKQAPADAVSAPVAPVAEAKPQETAQTVMDLNKPDDADIR